MEQPPSLVGDVIDFRDVVYAPLNSSASSACSRRCCELRFRWRKSGHASARDGTAGHARGWKKVDLACTFQKQ
jgi:hypothetical protein